MINFLKNIIWRIRPKKIYALIGPTGSGKSFRAFLIADKYKIDYIIDDGLLIKDQKIIAGKSAKKEPLKITAIKRAIFKETKHAREVRKTLYREHYTSLLIIAISELMLQRIIERLHLPKPTKIIRIQDISTDEEIKRAQKSRKKHGKHVIPIPMIEVKKKYPNIVLHAIHLFIDEPKGFFFKKKKRRLIEKTIVRPKYGTQGTITISETALVQMVSHCIAEYSSSIKLLKIVVTELNEGYQLNLKLAINYKMHDSKIIKEIQNIISNKIEEFTGIPIKKVDINIVEFTNKN
jgi:hypothetical protein